MKRTIKQWTLPTLLAAGLSAGVPTAVFAQSATEGTTPGKVQGTTSTNASTNRNNATNTSEAADAQQLVTEAQNAVKQMEQDPKMQKLLTQAKGVYIIPDFAKGGFVVGGWGGQGVMLRHVNGKWIGPAFFNLGAVSAGAEADFTAGTIAYLIMSDDAVNQFQTDNTFSLNASSSFSMINYSAMDQAAVGKGDMIIWSDTEGVYAGLSGSVSDITWDSEKNDGFYGKHVTAKQIMSGQFATPPAAKTLQEELSG